MKKLYLFLLALVCSVSMAWGDGTATLYSANFSDSKWSSADFAQGNSSTPKVNDGCTFYAKNSNSTYQFSISNGRLVWPANISTSNYYMAIPVSGVNGSITITAYDGNSNTRIKYAVKEGTTISAGSCPSATQTDVANPTTVTVNNLTKSDYVVYVGRQGTSYTGITSITITTPAITEPTIKANNLDIEAETTSGEIAYEILNAEDGVDPTAEVTTGDWISNLIVDAENEKITFDATANTTADERTATITIHYTGATDKVVTITQAVSVANRNYGIEAYRLNLVQCGGDTTGTDRSTAYVNTPAKVFATNSDKVSAVTVTRVYAGRQPMGAKFGGSSNDGTLVITLAAATNVQSIVFNAAMYGATDKETNADKGFTVTINNEVSGTSLGLSAGNKILEDKVLYLGGQSVSKITIHQNNSTNGRFYLHHIAICTEQTNVAISDAEYATYYNASSAFVMPTGLEGITVDGCEDNELTLTTSYSEGDVVPAGEALILHGEEGTYQLVAAKTNNSKVATNMLKGISNFDELTTGGATYYRLSQHDGQVGFYYGAAEGAAFKPGANKAYLAISAGQNAPAHFLFENEEQTATGIENIEAEEVVKFIENGQLIIIKNGVRYNALGQIVR